MEETAQFEYNSLKENLTIAEYGRHVQNLINHALTIEDRANRQKFTEGVIFLMFQMNSQQKNLAEVEEKLWKHAYKISNYQLDVTPPEGVVLSQTEMEAKPGPIGYPHHVRKNRHYGGYIQDMVKTAMVMEDPDKQREFIQIIGSYLKLAYKTWNKEHYANDEMIKSDLNDLTEGKFDYIKELSLDLLSSSGPANTQHIGRSKNKNNNNRKNNNRRPKQQNKQQRRRK